MQPVPATGGFLSALRTPRTNAETPLNGRNVEPVRATIAGSLSAPSCEVDFAISVTRGNAGVSSPTQAEGSLPKQLIDVGQTLCCYAAKRYQAHAGHRCNPIPFYDRRR